MRKQKLLILNRKDPRHWNNHTEILRKSLRKVYNNQTIPLAPPSQFRDLKHLTALELRSPTSNFITQLPPSQSKKSNNSRIDKLSTNFLLLDLESFLQTGKETQYVELFLIVTLSCLPVVRQHTDALCGWNAQALWFKLKITRVITRNLKQLTKYILVALSTKSRLTCKGHIPKYKLTLLKWFRKLLLYGMYYAHSLKGTPE